MLFPFFEAGSPPPVTATAFVTEAGALLATLTVSVIKGKLDPAAMVAGEVQESVATTQVQPDPVMAVAVRPEGNVSIKVTAVPSVGALPAFDTAMLYVAPAWPWVKLPVWLLVTVRSGAGGSTTVVGSDAVSFAVLVSPPPETTTLFVTEEAVAAPTFTVRNKLGKLFPG